MGNKINTLSHFLKYMYVNVYICIYVNEYTHYCRFFFGMLGLLYYVECHLMGHLYFSLLLLKGIGFHHTKGSM